MLILIVGKSASGKDYLAQELINRGLTQVISRTDRPPRNEDEHTHIFVSKDTAKQEASTAVAATNIADYNYYALDKDIENHDIYIVDPKGVRDLCKNMPDTAFHIVYIESNDEIRRARAIARADNPELAAQVFDERLISESPAFEEFRLICTDQPETLPINAIAVTVLYNDYEPTTLATAAENLIRYKHRFDGIKRMICDLSHYNIFDIDENMHFKANEDGEDIRLSLEQICAIFLADDEQLASLTRSWLGHHDLNKALKENE